MFRAIQKFGHGFGHIQKLQPNQKTLDKNAREETRIQEWCTKRPYYVGHIIG